MIPISTSLSRLGGTLTVMFFTALQAFSQGATQQFRIAASAIYADSAVIVRWTPVNLETWKWGNAEGYDLVRYTVIDQGDTLDGYAYDSSMVNLGVALKPLPESQWETYADSNDLAGVAASTIYGDSLDLLPPGGPSLLNIYNKSREAENRFTFSLFAADQDFSVAKMMGLAFMDTSARASSKYVYWVKPHDPDSLAEVKNGFALVHTDSSFVLPAPAGLRGHGGDSTAILNWKRNDQHFTSYVVERSIDGVNFTPANERPLISAVSPEADDGTIAFADSLYANGVSFIYRVRGRSPFGMLSQPSDTVQVTGVPEPIFALLSIENIEEVAQGQLTVTWNFPEDMENYVQGFDLYRGLGPDGPFTKLNDDIIPISVRSFVDIEPKPANYYLVRTTDAYGYPMESFPRLGQIKDDTPPSRPASVFGQADASGVVTLHWTRSPEPDVLGYRVFIANSQSGDYAQVTSVWLNDTTFLYQLNLNTLSEFVYFGVKALDYHHNQSPMSEPAQISRPDIIPPSAPLITTVEATPQGVTFAWVESSSSDVYKHEFQRKIAGLPGWTVLTEFTTQNPLSGFVDSTASKRRWYQYRLVAVDEAGNRGGSRIVKAKPINDGLRDSILNFGGQLVSGGGTVANYILLQWDYPKDVDLIGVQIFRGYDSSAMYSYRFFPYPIPASTDYADMAIFPNGNQHRFRFYDYDIAFDEPVLTTFSYIFNSNLNINQAVSPPQSQGTPGSPVDYIVPNPTATPPNTLKYWVMAKFADGTYSPLAGPVSISL
ncbi:MAG: hypothetical protein JNK89_03685 [Saprospiraceae bacterium]|nr:hypothetical protein [Saprospiraceae bacterium]